MIYCFTHSSLFTKEVESILLDDGYKGLFGKSFLIKLAETYKEAFDPNSNYNKNKDEDSKALKLIRNRIGHSFTESRKAVGKIPIDEVNELIEFYKKIKERNKKKCFKIK